MMPDQLPLAGKSIFIIDDEPLIAMSVESSLQVAGAAGVKSVSSVTQAQSALEETSYDAAVVDFHLPDGDASLLIGTFVQTGHTHRRDDRRRH